MTFMEEAEELVETVSLRMELRLPAEMPLADKPGGVTGVVQDLRDDLGLDRAAAADTFITSDDDTRRRIDDGVIGEVEGNRLRWRDRNFGVDPTFEINGRRRRLDALRTAGAVPRRPK